MWYPEGMLILVLTGGLGAGKTTAARYFRSRGAVTLDLDELAAKVMSPGSEVLCRVAEEFGADEILLADGRLDRPALARAAFVSPADAARLDSIVHPAVLGEAHSEIARLRRLPEPPSVVVLEVPLLVEAPALAQIADRVLAIVAPEALRVSRAVTRGMGEAEARRRIRAQATDAERAQLADTVIINDGTREVFVEQLESFWDANFAQEEVSR